MLRDHYDVIVAGSGPGGAAVARTLSRGGARVLILERGEYPPHRLGLFALGSMLRSERISDTLTMTKASAVGGTTSVYFAVGAEPPLALFQKQGIDLSGPLEHTRSELPLHQLPDELIGQQSLWLRRSAEEAGHPWSKRTMLVDLDKCRDGYRADARWTARDYVMDAVEHGAHLVCGATVERVIIEGRRAVGVEYCLSKGRGHHERQQALAARTVLSCGGADTARVLRRSGMTHAGRDGFYCHPAFGLFAAVPGLRSGESFAGSLGMEWDDGLTVGDANFPRVFFNGFMIGARAFLRLLQYRKTIGIGVMLMESVGGGLDEDDRYRKTLGDDQLHRLGEGERIATKILERAGARRVLKSRLSAGHVGGTVRLQEHLDSDLQTEYRGLHVCDASVIPDAMKVPPTLTLICLGKHLAGRLAGAAP